ncbi:hypothetical protein GGS23DRAFT_595341 [Durotheca rogersii]|uniref:uncharacterized protein n=1 Tax=Durotheca rogersii TaxID=419775 RepID=UPI00221F2599|nr:uncharacterized protein GGS23DRAFT_595341 [Durotheca rogersii]KAI5864622.1 hypothetical protein GGS23DRAFT_595341 [Durotheca rogersii]
MSHPPSTPVKVPTSAATYTPATLDPDLRSQINMLLIRDGHITKIQDHLLHALNSHPSNWPSNVQAHALALLRNGDATTFPALVRRVLEDVRQETAAAAASSSSSSSDTNEPTNSNGNNNGNSAATTHGEVNGTAAATNGRSGAVNGSGATSSSFSTSSSSPPPPLAGDGSLAVPPAVVEAVLKVTRECLEAVCEVDDGSSAG